MLGIIIGTTSIEVMTGTSACMSTSSNPSMPYAPAGHIEGWVAEYVDGEVWLCGGADLNFHSECFSIAIGSAAWTQVRGPCFVELRALL